MTKLCLFQYFNVPNANCTTDSDCVQGAVDFDGHGTTALTSSFLTSGWLVGIQQVFSSNSNTLLQAGGLEDVFSTTIIPSKPVRSKPGVLSRSML